jgi:potassium/chloride transporter 4/5/6
MIPDWFALFGPINIPNNAYNSYRVYGTALLLFMFICVYSGVKFVSMFSPIALFCVLGSIVCVYIGIFMASPSGGPM